jgi:hypothetical protein
MDMVEETKPQVEGEIVIMHYDEVEVRTPTSECQAEQNGAHVMVDEVVQNELSLSTPRNGEVSHVVETELKSEALVLKEKASPALDPQEEARYVEEFLVVKPASNMRLESEISATEGWQPGNVQTGNEEPKPDAECSRIERKFSCSEEASVDVHSEDSEKRGAMQDLKAVSIVESHALLLQESSEGFAGVAQEVETEPSLAVKWSYEVSVDVILPDEWVEVEMHSVAEPEASTAGRAPSDTPSPPGLLCTERENSNLITEHEAPSATGAIELENQGRELTSESLSIEEPTGTEREMASPISFGTQESSMNPPEQQFPDSGEWEAHHSTESETTGQELQPALPIQGGKPSEIAVPSSSQDEDLDFRLCRPAASGKADESMVWEFAPPQVERINVAESSPCTSESPVLPDVELTCERTTDVDSNQGEMPVKSTGRVPSFADWEREVEVDDRTTGAVFEELESTSASPKQSEGIADTTEHVQSLWSLKNLKKRPLMVEPRAVTEQAMRSVKPKAPKAVGLSWPPAPLAAAEDKQCVDTSDALTSPRQPAAEFVGATATIAAEAKEELLVSPSDQSIHGAEANIKEPGVQRLWSLKYLKTRPVMVEPRTVTQQILKPVKLKAPKVVGLSWPPTPLAAAEDKHCVDTNDALTSPRQTAAECGGATDVIAAEAKEELELVSPPDQGIHGAEANMKEPDVQRVWSLKYFQTSAVTVETRTITQQILEPLKLKAPKVVGLSWPPAPLTAAEDKHCVDTNDALPSPSQTGAESVGATATIAAEAKEELQLVSPSDHGAEANMKEPDVQRVCSLEYLKTRAVMVEPRSVTKQILEPVTLKAPKVVGLSWPPAPLTAAEDKHCVDTNDTLTSPRQTAAESGGATDTIAAEAKEELEIVSPSDHGLEANMKESDDQGAWSLEYLKTRAVMVEPRTVTQQILEPMKLTAPKVVGLSWPPAPLTAAEDKHCMDTNDALTSPRQAAAGSVGATDTMAAEAKEELLVSPSEQGILGLEANMKSEPDVQGVWSLDYFETRAAMVETRTVTQQIIEPLKLKAPKVVGLSWPPAPLTTAAGINGVFS